MYRFFEILPGLTVWLVLITLVILSYLTPLTVAIFIVLYDLFWLLRTLYLLLHLRFSFLKLRANLKIDWLTKLQSSNLAWSNIHHLIIFPMYQESYDLVRESFLSLVKANYPKDKLFVVLATEERGFKEDARVALKIEEEFKKEFGGFLVTKHPQNLPGELPGKGSNETWAAKEAIRTIIEPKNLNFQNVLVSVFDIDTRPGGDYFAILTYQFFSSEKGNRSSFQPVPLFINNIHDVSPFARLIAFTSTFWQFMQQARPEQLITFSSHSMPLQALHEVGFWNVNIVSEDSRIFFQCFLHYKGDWRSVPLYYPIYMDAVSGGSFMKAMQNLYKQQRRWAWGVENIAYVFSNFLNNKMISFRRKILWVFVLFEGSFSWAASSFIIFLFGFLPVLLGGAEFNRSVFSYNLPRVTGFLMNFSVIGIIVSAWLSILILLPRLKGFSIKFYFIYFLQWLLTPATILLFGSLPALEAETRLMLGGRFRLGFWKTPKK